MTTDSFPPAEQLETPETIDDTSVDIFYLLDRLEELVSSASACRSMARSWSRRTNSWPWSTSFASPYRMRSSRPSASSASGRRSWPSRTKRPRGSSMPPASAPNTFVSQEGILNEARLKGEQVLQDAHDKRNRVMGEIDAYALEQFDKVEEAMRTGLALIDESLEETVCDHARGPPERRPIGIAQPYWVLCADRSHSHRLTA